MTVSPARPTLRSVAMPAEHGGWGLTLEPGILGFLLAPSLAALLLAVAALLAFLTRAPLRLVLLRRRRGHEHRPTAMGEARSALATRVAGIELGVLVVVLLGAALLAIEPLWWLLPGAVALPLFGLALWFDMHSQSRRLAAEVAGSVAVASAAAMGALAGGAGWPLAIGAWLILCARISSSIPHVRAQVGRLHGRAIQPLPGVVGDGVAVGVAGAAVLLEPSLVPGAVAVMGLIGVQRVTLARPPRPAKVLGVRQMMLGFAVVGATALGAWLL